MFIDGTRSGYAPEQCDETMTVNQMIEKLIELRDYDNAGDCPIYLSNDNGYTYGPVSYTHLDVYKRQIQKTPLKLEQSEGIAREIGKITLSWEMWIQVYLKQCILERSLILP